MVTGSQFQSCRCPVLPRVGKVASAPSLPGARRCPAWVWWRCRCWCGEQWWLVWGERLWNGSVCSPPRFFTECCVDFEWLRETLAVTHQNVVMFNCCCGVVLRSSRSFERWPGRKLVVSQSDIEAPHRDRRMNLEICETFNQREEGGDKLLVRGAVLHSGSVGEKKPWQEWPSVMAGLEAQIVFCWSFLWINWKCASPKPWENTFQHGRAVCRRTGPERECVVCGVFEEDFDLIRPRGQERPAAFKSKLISKQSHSLISL